MEEWCRFSVCWWHTFRGTGADPFGAGTIDRPWDDGTETLDNALRRVDAAFEFFTKLGVPYYTFHDVDVAPVSESLSEFNSNFDKVADKLEAKQQETGVKLLWGTANLFSHPRYMNGGMTNPDFDVFARAGAQVSKAMEVTHRLGGENYVFWGGREGYQTILNTRPRQELDNAAAFFRMAVEHKESLGADFQLLIEPKPREPTKHQYDYDAQTVIGFLKTYDLADHYKINVEPNHTTLAGHNYEHDIIFSSAFGMLGSIDANTGDELLGWDTDQFPSNVKQTALTMGTVIDQGGLAPGGLNFDCKVRRESTDLNDFFISHVGAMDAFARGLKAAAAIREEGTIPGMIAKRYSSWESHAAQQAAQGKTTFRDMQAHAEKAGEPAKTSGQQELYEMEWARFV
jgi:xylose isomerase